MLQFPPDFSEFLRLLNDHEVRYLLIGGYAVGYYGYPRVTGDMDNWIANDPQNAERMVDVIQEFGFTSGISAELFLRDRAIIRLGVPPNRLEVTTFIDGVEFDECEKRGQVVSVGATTVRMIALADLRRNKKAA